MNMIELDGAHGEGGGQILRTALSLSMITGKPFCIENIRAKRRKPGLLRQHLTAVQAASAICGAKTEHAELGSTRLGFIPGPIQGGDYRFAIGSAGSTTLVLQTILPALWFANAPSTVHVTGGTHNPAAPPVDFLQHSWLPLIQQMGVYSKIECLRHGFFPAGGGEVLASTQPCPHLQPLSLKSRGELLFARAVAVVAGVPADVARRELERIQSQLEVTESELRHLPSGEGPGNVAMLMLNYENVCETFTAFGERGLAAEIVADRACREARSYREGNAVVAEHLADQLVLPMALAGGGYFTTNKISSHLQTNLAVINEFLTLPNCISELGNDLWSVEMG